MTSTRKLTFADYLALDDSGLEGQAELIDGVLTELPPETWFNNDIVMFLFLKLVEIGIPFQQVKVHSCELQTPMLESGDAANRYPDLVVVDEVHRAKPNQRMTITLDMPPPHLVVEVASPGKTNRDRDYVRKRAQYAAIGIPQYLIVDPQDGVVILLILTSDGYRDAGRYEGKERVPLPTFPDLDLTAEQILTARQVE